MIKKILSLGILIIFFIFIVTSLHSCLNFVDDITDKQPKDLETLSIAYNEVSFDIGKSKTISIYVEPYDAICKQIELIFDEEYLELKFIEKQNKGTTTYFNVGVIGKKIGNTELSAKYGEITSNVIVINIL